MDDFQFSGKHVICRIGIDSPYDEETGKIIDNERFEAHTETIKELKAKQAKVALLAHQGRKGNADCTTLEQHASILSEKLGFDVRYVNDLQGSIAINAINSLKEGEVILLENVRFSEEEAIDATPDIHARSIMVTTLAPHFDYYIDDAFNNAHRPHCSMTGFPMVLKSCAGRLMQREYEGAMRATKFAKKPVVYVLGGAKSDDCFKLLKYAIKQQQVDHLLTSGIIGELCLLAQGIDTGVENKIREKDWKKSMGELASLLKVPGVTRVHTPIDLAFSENEVRKEADVNDFPSKGMISYDIGSKTADNYADMIMNAGTVYLKGPVGMYEKQEFELGTRKVFDAAVQTSAFTIMGGGHTLEAMQKFGLDEKKIKHISNAGGALISVLCGETLPAIEALEISKRKLG